MKRRPPIAPANWPSWLAVVVLSLLWLLPYPVRNALAAQLAKFALRRESSQRRAININLEACFPELDDTARRALHLQYMTRQLQAALAMPRLWWASRNSIVKKSRVHNQAIVDDAVAAGRAVVLLTTHTVALDAGLVIASRLHPMQGIYKPLDNKVLDWLVYRARNRFGGEPVSRGSGFRKLIKGLTDGILLIYLCDEDLGAEGSVFAPIFGHRKATLTMLPRIVSKTDALVIPMASYYNPDNDGIDVHFFPPLQNYPQLEQLSDATIMNEAIANTIRKVPEQFLWKLRIFKTCPEGGGTRYGQIERGEISTADL